MDKHQAHDIVHTWNGGMANNCPYCTGAMDDKEMIGEAKKIALNNARPRINPDLPASQRMPMMYSESELAELDAAARNNLKDSDFAYIDSQGNRHLPIHDAAHVRNALARFNQTHFDSESAKASAKRKIDAKAKELGVGVASDKKDMCEVQTFVDILSFSEDGRKLPSVMKILPFGRFETEKGFADITNQRLQEMVKHFHENVRASSSKIGLPVDLEHGKTAHLRAAAAWMKDLFAKENDGLYAKMDYTELGRNKLLSGEYKCFSPSFYLEGYIGPQDGKEYNNVVTGGAFTNTPVLTHALEPVVFSEEVKFTPLTDDKNSNTLILEITKTQRTMNLSEIAAKPQNERTSDEQKFLVDHKDELTFSQYKAEGFLTQKKETQLAEGQVAVDAKEWAETKAAASAGAQAAKKLQREELLREVKQLVFSEDGSKLPTDQIEKAVDLLMDMSEDMQVKYKDQLKNLPSPKQFVEVGTAGAAVDFSQNPGAQWNELVNKRKEEKKITFSQAEDQLRTEQPELFRKAYEMKTA